MLLFLTVEQLSEHFSKIKICWHCYFRLLSIFKLPNIHRPQNIHKFQTYTEPWNKQTYFTYWHHEPVIIFDEHFIEYSNYDTEEHFDKYSNHDIFARSAISFHIYQIDCICIVRYRRPAWAPFASLVTNPLFHSVQWCT